MQKIVKSLNGGSRFALIKPHKNMVATKKRSSASCSLASCVTDKTLSDRSKNASFFHQCYADLCRLRNIQPNSGIKARAGKFMLDLCGDRLKIDEWAPIIEALKYDRNLHFIAFRSKYPVKSVLEEANTEQKAREVLKRPVLLSKFIFKLLLESLAQCLAESTSITCIEMDGLPLTKEYMLILCNGLAANTSLQTISFCNSPIGDEGCKQLCLLVRNMPSVLHLDLSNCDLKTESAVAITETLKYQTLQRFAESWKQSLRYREPNIESMPGLRRIILNNNVLIGDKGVQTLTEVLKEDFWIRAVDLQNCGISNVGAQNILETLGINNTLCIVDVRENRYIDDSLIHQIMLKLFHNNANKEAHEYNWIIPQSQLTVTPSNSTIRSRPSLFLKQNSSLSVRPPSVNRRCMSQCTIKKETPNIKTNATKVVIKLQKNLSSASQSSTAIKLSTTDGQSARRCVSRMRETMEKFKKPNIQSTPSTPLRKKIESKFEKSVQENMKTLQDQDNSYCLMKKEAYDAVFETLGRFYLFIEHMKQTNKVFAQDNGRQGDGDHAIQYQENKSIDNGLTAPPARSNTPVTFQGSSQDMLICSGRKNKIADISNPVNFSIQKDSFGDNSETSEPGMLIQEPFKCW